MKITKVDMTIKLQSTHKDSLEQLLLDVIKQLNDEKPCGSFWHSDGDSAEWNISQKEVELYE